jgi:dihydroorotate dehydrogenase electron transfer subunit
LFDVSLNVSSHTQLFDENYRMVLHSEAPLPALQAGQFFMLQIPYANGFLFRRPFSPYLMDAHTLTFVYAVVGEGTEALTQVRVGDTLKVLLPLGHPFPSNHAASETLLVSGGVGVAPMMTQVQAWHEQGQTAAGFVFGGRSQQHLQLIEAERHTYLAHTPTLLSTNDGSAGIQGSVIDTLVLQPSSFFTPLKQVFICGPTRMMHACMQWFNTHHPHLRVLVSLENHMPCGTGACYGCVVGQSHGKPPIRVCLEGPVFDAAHLAWSSNGVLEVRDFPDQSQATSAIVVG